MRRFRGCSGGKTKDAVSRNEDQDPAADAGNPHNSPPVTSNTGALDQNPPADADNPPATSNTSALDQNVGTSSVSTSNDGRPRGQFTLTFSYYELAKITNNLDENSIIGQGDCGPVYKGTINDSGQIAAGKKLNNAAYIRDEEFSMEVDKLSRLHHPHLVDLIGYCSEGRTHRLLVYEQMPLGSLDEHLYDPQPPLGPLDWKTRMSIALGTAKGLNYLHNEASPPVTLVDLKTTNILLDESLNPKLTDFGTAPFSVYVSPRTRLTHGYSAPEFLATGKLTTRCNVYSFGAILVALIMGRRPIELLREQRGQVPPLLCNWMSDRDELYKVVDSVVQRDQYEKLSLGSAAKLALECLELDPEIRPTMEEVLRRMKEVVTQANQSRALTLGDAETCASKGKGKGKLINPDDKMISALDKLFDSYLES